MITCPFCGETDFDLVGLKHHLTYYCETYQQIDLLPHPLHEEADHD